MWACFLWVWTEAKMWYTSCLCPVLLYSSPVNQWSVRTSLQTELSMHRHTEWWRVTGRMHIIKYAVSPLRSIFINYDNLVMGQISCTRPGAISLPLPLLAWVRFRGESNRHVTERQTTFVAHWGSGSDDKCSFFCDFSLCGVPPQQDLTCVT